MQRRLHSHIETFTQMVSGQIIAQGVLYAFGIPIGKSLIMGGLLLVLHYIKTYWVRRFFNWVEVKR